VFQVLVYREARQHENQILSQQVSLEARVKFEKEKKALKLTATIMLAIGLCYVPPFIVMLTLNLLRRYIFNKWSTSVLHVAVLPAILNSLLNPVI